MNSEVQSAVALAERTNYLNKEIKYLRNVEISEWDIHAAGFSVLKFRQLLPADELEKLYKLDKHSRTVKEGLLQKANPRIAQEIIETLAKVRKAFVILNKIPESAILSIKKDALFLINQNPTNPIIKDIFEFRKKNLYSSYLYLNGKEFYYSSALDTIDIKGINNEVAALQNDFFLKDIRGILKAGESGSQESLFRRLKEYRRKYLARELPIETYRDLETGTYRIGNYELKDAGEDMRDSLDITQNYINYLLPLFSALL